MRVFRAIASILLATAAFGSVLYGCLLGATQIGLINPLVDTSGSMEPDIKTGALIIDVPTPTSQLKVGDVVSLHSAITSRTVTHRIISIAPLANGGAAIQMKGDANAQKHGDGETYLTGRTTWATKVHITGAGYVYAALHSPNAWIPALIGMLALIAFTLIGGSAKDRTPDSKDSEHQSSANRTT